ncbi:MAG: hypothetical protein V3U37_00870 [Nitrospinaceae bacterium]
MNPKNPSLPVLAVVAVLSLGTVIKVYLAANSELKTAETSFSQNNLDQAATHYERSIQWYLPGLGPQTEAAEGLWSVAMEYESRADTEKALSAYRLLRGAFYSTRSFYTPGAEWINRCNEKIASLMAAKPAYSESDKNKTFEQRKKEMLTLLTAEKSPHAFWAVLGVFGFLGWVTCSVLFIVRALTESGNIKTRPALFWGAGFALSYGLWVLGMANT